MDARSLALKDPAFLEQAQDDATELAVRDMERAGLVIVSDGEVRRESYFNRFANSLGGLDVDNPGEMIGRDDKMRSSRAWLARSSAPNPCSCATSKCCAR